MHTIQLFDDITENTLGQFAEALNDAPNGEEICLQICSAGGLVFCAFGILDYLRSRNFRVTAEVLGMAASAAALLALASDRVRMSPLGSLMLHSAYIENPDVQDDAGVKRANDLQLQIIQKRCPSYTEADLHSDRWIGLQEALRMGLCDEPLEAEEVKAFCSIYLNSRAAGKEATMALDEEKKAPCAEAIEEPKKDDVQAEDMPSQDDFLEKIVERLEAIEHRLGVLEGEGKKADDEGDGIDPVARRRALYARITAPSPAPVARATERMPKASKLDLSKFMN